MNTKTTYDYEAVENNLEQLLEIDDFSEYTECFRKLYQEGAIKEKFSAFIETETFGKDLQKRIQTATGVKETVLCFDYLVLTNIGIAKLILNYRGFGSSVLPVKLNEEQDIEMIGLCLEIVSQCDPLLCELITTSEDLDRAKIISLLNQERDLYKLGHSIERMWRGNQAFARELVESASFDIERLVKKLHLEKDEENTGMCLCGIEFASPAVAQHIKEALLVPSM